MKRLLVIALVLVVIAGGYWIYSRQAERTEAKAPEGIRTETVTRGSIEALVSATGNITAERTQAITFNSSGVAMAVLVAEGQAVTAGQLLARLDPGDLELSLKQAEAGLRVSEAQLAKTKAGPKAEDIAVAEVAVEIAKAGVRSAEAGVAVVRANLARVQAGPSAEEIAIAERRVEEAKNSLWGVQSQRDTICGRVQFGLPQSDCDNTQASVARAEQGVRIAELQLQQTRRGARQEDISSSQAQVSQALAQVESAKTQVLRSEVDLARAKRGASAEDVAVVEAQVAQAQVAVEIARKRLNDLQVTAPADGVLTRWTVNQGDLVSPGASLGTLVNADAYHVMVQIDETEIGQVREGQLVRLQLDAFPEAEIEGRVTRISLSGASEQGIVTYRVRVDLDAGDLPIKPMMTASLSIVVETKDNVLLVPNRAIRRDARGRYVEVLIDGAVKRADVVIGISDGAMTEVLSGLQDGQQAVVSAPRENVFSGMGGAFGGQ
jgi:HlyD family secretion protein